MNISYSLMLLTFFLSLFHFLYGYKEALRISNEKGKVQGWPVIISIPLGFTFAYFANIFYVQI